MTLATLILHFIHSDQEQSYKLSALRSFLIVSIQVFLGLTVPLKVSVTSKQLTFLTVASMDLFVHEQTILDVSLILRHLILTDKIVMHRME